MLLNFLLLFSLLAVWCTRKLRLCHCWYLFNPEYMPHWTSGCWKANGPNHAFAYMWIYIYTSYRYERNDFLFVQIYIYTIINFPIWPWLYSSDKRERNLERNRWEGGDVVSGVGDSGESASHRCLKCLYRMFQNLYSISFKYCNSVNIRFAFIYTLFW